MHTLTETTLWGIRWLLTIVTWIVLAGWPVANAVIGVAVYRRLSGKFGDLAFIPSKKRPNLRDIVLVTMWGVNTVSALFVWQALYMSYVVAICVIATIVMYVPGIHWPKKKPRQRPMRGMEDCG